MLESNSSGMECLAGAQRRKRAVLFYELRTNAALLENVMRKTPGSGAEPQPELLTTLTTLLTEISPYRQTVQRPVFEDS